MALIFKCPTCRTTLFEPLAAADDKRSMTRRLLSYVCKQVFGEPFGSPARQVGLDEKTIRNMFEDLVAKLQGQVRCRTPKALGVDELRVVGACRAIITNVEKPCPFDMLKTRMCTGVTP